MEVRSGRVFAPYEWKGLFRLVQIAVARGDERFEQGADDSKGLGIITSRPLSSLTELESEALYEQ